MAFFRGMWVYTLLQITLVLTLFATNAHGFFPTDWREKYFGKNGVSHESQTKQAYESLATKYFPDIKPLKKTMLKARDAIAEANAKVDDDQKTSGKHFDGESFGAGATRLVDLKKEVFGYLNAGNGDEARKSLGGALHTLQDFYAHTNWVELGNSDINYNLGKSVSLPYAGFNDTTCSQCGPASRLLSECHDCTNNTNGYTQLTSGYYFGEDSPPAGVPIPDFKCHHGGVTDNSWGAIWGVAVGDVTPGINKDSNNCFWSPHSHLHPTAAALAIKATIQYIEDIVAELDTRKTKLLFGVGGTMAFAIDTTGSMSDIIAGVRQQSIAIVNGRLDTPDEPSSFVVAPFNDPTTGPDTVTSDYDSFQAAISNLVAFGGDDCPELSLTGMLDAMSLMDGPADLFVMTDAAPKDFDRLAQVVATAFEKTININIFKFDSNCDDGLAKRQDSASNSVYGSIATSTGGSYHSLPRTEVLSISGLLDTITKSDNTGILKIDDTAAANKTTTYKVPVDSEMSEMSVSIRGVGVTVSLIQPDGSTLDLSSPGVTSTALTDGQFTTVKSPATGFWTVSISGEGNFSLDVTGVTSLHFSRFDFVALSGRPGHEGYFPISDQPAYDHEVAAVAVIDGSFSSAKFDLRSPDGTVVVDVTMEAGSGADDGPPANSFYGEMTLAPGTLYAYCSGLDSTGVPYQRVLSSVFTPILSNTTDTGINNTDPFEVLRNATTSTTITSSSTTIISSTITTSIPYSNATTTTTKLTYNNSTTTILSYTTTTCEVTSSSASVSSYSTESYHWTPPTYVSSTWRSSHTCKPGVVYTHSQYGSGNSGSATDNPNYQGYSTATTGALPSSPTYAQVSSYTTSYSSSIAETTQAIYVPSPDTGSPESSSRVDYSGTTDYSTANDYSTEAGYSTAVVYSSTADVDYSTPSILGSTATATTYETMDASAVSTSAAVYNMPETTTITTTGNVVQYTGGASKQRSDMIAPAVGLVALAGGLVML